MTETISHFVFAILSLILVSTSVMLLTKYVIWLFKVLFL